MTEGSPTTDQLTSSWTGSQTLPDFIVVHEAVAVDYFYVQDTDVKTYVWIEGGDRTLQTGIWHNYDAIHSANSSTRILSSKMLFSL